MQFKTKIAIVVFSTVVAFYAIVGSFMSKSGQAVARGSQHAQLRIFDEVLDHIIRDYVDQPDLEKVRIGSMRGLAEGLDPYSAYLTPEQVKQFDPKGTQNSTGLIVSKVSGYGYVVAVLKDSPAEAAGIHAGDVLEYVGTIPSRDLSLYDIDQLLSGQAGTAIDLRILHNGQPRRLKLTRGKVAQPDVETRIEETGIGYIHITSLTPGHLAQVKTAIQELTSKGAQKILLDLRGAANGSIEESVGIANLFVGDGPLARVVGKGGKEAKAYNAEPDKVAFSGPLAVVIDRSTSGPAEIIAAAVRDRKRGEVVGDRTFGAGSEQQLFPLSDGGALLITTARYAPGSGKPFMEEPVTPTVRVERPVPIETVLPEDNDDDSTDDERQEQVAPPKPTEPVDDVQLKKALELLKQTSAKVRATQKTAEVKRKARKVARMDAASEIRLAA